MQGATPWFASLRGALLVTSASAAVVGWSGGAHAQATGQVEVETQSPTLQLILAPPEPELNVVLVPRYSSERYEAYREVATLLDFIPDIIIRAEGAFQVPEFTIETTGISAGLEYLFSDGFFVGGSLNYSHADFDFDEPSPITRRRQIIVGESRDLFAAIGAGDPVHREFDEYGGAVALGYFGGSLALVLTGGVSYRDNATRRREFALGVLEGDYYEESIAEFDSERYSVDLGAAYRLEFDEVSLRPFASIGYNREEVDGYSEDLAAAFVDSGAPDGGFVPISPPVSGVTQRRFNDQTIESIPLTVGALVSVPLGGAEAGGDSGGIIGFPGLTAGISYTHDFEDQERTIIADSKFFRTQVIAEEENRNQDFLTLLGWLDISLFGRASATLAYEHDFGFDEREAADTVSLELRIPLQ